MDSSSSNTKDSPKGHFTRRHSVRRSIKRNWSDFCRSTSLHGLKYIAEKDRSWFDRMFWMCVFLASTGIAVALIVKIWKRWEESPVLVSFDDKASSIWEIPFPAITLCSEVKIKRTVLNLTNLVINYTEGLDLSEKLEFSSIICDVTTLGDNDTTSEKFIDFLNDVSPRTGDVFGDLHCSWHQETAHCDFIFAPTITDDGLCYTFNGFPPGQLYKSHTLQRQWWSYRDAALPNWSLEGGYREVPRDYPWRTHSAGSRAGLRIPLILRSEEVDPLCRVPVDAFKLAVHSPADFPLVLDHFFRIPMSFDTVIGIRPFVSDTAPGLRSYDPKRRGCYFDGERDLRHFQVYTEHNCNVECITNYTLSRCECVAYFMPRSEKTPVCAEGMKPCIKEAREMFYSGERAHGACSCLPACTEIKYDVESSSQAPIKLEATTSILLQDQPEKAKTLSRTAYVTLYFNKRFFVKSIRRELYGIADFIANCGGLLGFYLGFSILSLIEIIYFFSMRFISNRKSKQQQQQHSVNT